MQVLTSGTCRHCLHFLTSHVLCRALHSGSWQSHQRLSYESSCSFLHFHLSCHLSGICRCCPLLSSWDIFFTWHLWNHFPVLSPVSVYMPSQFPLLAPPPLFLFHPWSSCFSLHIVSRKWILTVTTFILNFESITLNLSMVLDQPQTEAELFSFIALLYLTSLVLNLKEGHCLILKAI